MLTSGDGGVFPRGLPVGTAVQGPRRRLARGARHRRRADRLRPILLFTRLLASWLAQQALAPKRPADGDDRGAERRRSPPPIAEPPPSPAAAAAAKPRRHAGRGRQAGDAARRGREPSPPAQKARADARRAAAKPRPPPLPRRSRADSGRHRPPTRGRRGFGSAKPLSPVGWLGAADAALRRRDRVLATPIRIFGLALPEPVFPLALAFAWAVIRPSVLPPFALLAAGPLPRPLLGRPAGPVAALPAGGLRRWCWPCAALIRARTSVVLWAWYGAATAPLAFGVGFLLMTLAAGDVAEPGRARLAIPGHAVLFPFAHRLIERYEDADVRFR